MKTEPSLESAETAAESGKSAAETSQSAQAPANSKGCSNCHHAACNERDWAAEGWIGCQGHKAPYVSLADMIDTTCYPILHEEICLGLTDVEYSYTGGSHKSMGIVPPDLADDPYKDYMQIIRAFSREEFLRFIALGDPEIPIDPSRQKEYTFGEEATVPMTWRQYQYLKIRYGAYFPWKLYLQMMDGEFDWTSKNTLVRDFDPHIKHTFPLTCEFIRSLPFVSIGRCDLLGLEANDFGTIHRDNYQRRDNPPVMDFITICPAGNKSLFLYNDDIKEKLVLPGNIYTFNDMNYHGVAPEPYFRYSIRIDGVFTEEFSKKLRGS